MFMYKYSGRQSREVLLNPALPPFLLSESKRGKGWQGLFLSNIFPPPELSFLSPLVFMYYFDNPGGQIPSWLINWVAKVRSQEAGGGSVFDKC